MKRLRRLSSSSWSFRKKKDPSTKVRVVLWRKIVLLGFGGGGSMILSAFYYSSSSSSSSFVWQSHNVPNVANDVPSATATPAFSILPLPELTTWLIGNFTNEAIHFYNQQALNEEQGELWLHRGFLRLLLQSHEPLASPDHPVIIVSAYLHFNQYLYKRKGSIQPTDHGTPYSTDDWIRILQQRVQEAVTHNKDTRRMTFLLAVPTWNPTRGNEIGLSKISRFFDRILIPQHNSHDQNIRYVSLGYERNVHWQKVSSPRDILPIPYVVAVPKKIPLTQSLYERIPNSIFYVGDTRPNAVRWSGCNRTALLQPFHAFLETSNASYVRLIPRKAPRLPLDEYHRRMAQSQYCLIVCGDTPTSRSLSSAIVHGCTPLFIGMERWYGYCEAPCHRGWGWTILHNGTYTPNAAAISHFPFATLVDYSQFPSVKEIDVMTRPALSALLPSQFVWSTAPEAPDIASMFLYGFGDPVTTEDFGNAVPYMWESFVRTMLY